MDSAKSRILELASIILLPAVLLACVFFGLRSSALLIFLAAIFSIVVFFASWESSRPALRQIMPVAVLSALAAAGRIVLAAAPSVQPVTAICIIGGAAFGRRKGFMTGSLTAFVSNCFLGQGMWTPWQMYAWGLVGYLAGVIFSSTYTDRKVDFEHTINATPARIDRVDGNTTTHASRKQHGAVSVCAFGFFASYLFSFLMDTWAIVGFFENFSAVSILAIYAAGLSFDTAHAISTVVFLGALYPLWDKKLVRIKRKYALGN